MQENEGIWKGEFSTLSTGLSTEKTGNPLQSRGVQGKYPGIRLVSTGSYKKRFGLQNICQK
jgi:hypothetical protein